MKSKFLHTIALVAVTFALVAGSAAYAEKQTSFPITGGKSTKTSMPMSRENAFMSVAKAVLRK